MASVLDPDTPLFHPLRSWGCVCYILGGTNYMQDILKNYFMKMKGQTPDGFKEPDLIKHLVYANFL